VPALAQLAEAWFRDEPDLPSFVFRAIFQELSALWDDPQGIPTADYLPYENRLLPELLDTADLLIAGETPENLAHHLRALVETFRMCRFPTP